MIDSELTRAGMPAAPQEGRHGIMDATFDRTVYLLERSLDLRMARQNLIAANIANVETPGYRALDLNFEEVMKETAARLDAQESDGGAVSAIDPVHVKLIADDAPSLGNDNNTVQLEKELGKLNENAMMFRIQTEFLAKKLTQMKEALGGP